ncbi:hypothetical protein BDR22DRAFT_884993 [Usnea florida]
MAKFTIELRTWSHLPSQLQEYVEFIESSVDIKVCCRRKLGNLMPAYDASRAVDIGSGQDHEDLLLRSNAAEPHWASHHENYEQDGCYFAILVVGAFSAVLLAGFAPCNNSMRHHAEV